MKFIKKVKKGFTLVELVVVIAIIAILSGVSVAIYSGVTDSAKKTADSEIITQLNVQMRAQGVYGKNNTCSEAYEDARGIGFDLSLMKPSYGDHYVWDQEHDLFAVTKGDEIVAQDKTETLTTNLEKRWIFNSVIDSTEKRSQFATAETYDTVSVISGFDSGVSKSIGSINFTNPNKVGATIYTSSASTTLNIEDPSNSEIKHYGTLGKLVITHCGYECYYEYGTTAFAQAENGKVVAKEGGEITVLQATEASLVAVEDGGEIGEAYCYSNTPTEESLQGFTNFSNGKGGNITFQYTIDGTKEGEPFDKESGTIEAIGQTSIDDAVEEERIEDFKENNYWIGNISDDFAGGTGTSEDPYLIATAQQLSRLSYLSNSSHWEDYYSAHYKLTANIDLSGKCWIPIGAFARKVNVNRYFAGTFDGNGKTINGLNSVGLSMVYVGTMMNDTTPLDGVEFIYGLFGGVNGATIKNFNLTNVSISVGTGETVSEDGNRYLGDSVGAVVGYHHQDALTLEDIAVSGSVAGYDDVGGVIGRTNTPAKVTLTRCANAANVTSVRRASGLLGYAMDYYFSVTFSGCSNSGTITCLGPNSDYQKEKLEGSGRYGAAAMMFIASDSNNVTTAPSAEVFVNTGYCFLIISEEEVDATIYYYYSHYSSK